MALVLMQVVKVQDAQSSLLDAMIRLEEAENEVRVGVVSDF